MTGDKPAAWWLMATGIVLIVIGVVLSIAPLAELRVLGLQLVGFGVAAIVGAVIAAAIGFG